MAMIPLSAVLGALVCYWAVGAVIAATSSLASYIVEDFQTMIPQVIEQAEPSVRPLLRAYRALIPLFIFILSCHAWPIFVVSPSVPADDPAHAWHADLIRPWSDLDDSERAMWRATGERLRSGSTLREGAYAGWLEHGERTGAFAAMSQIPTFDPARAFENAAEFWCLLADAARSVNEAPS